MADVVVQSYKMTEIKTRLLSPALTSHFQCFFYPPDPVKKWIEQKKFYISDRQATPSDKDTNVYDNDLNLSLSCCEASLPGSTFQTHDVMAYAGVSEKFAYMRAYDDRSDFTFYVNDQYQQLKYFEGWSSFIADEQYNPEARGGLESDTYSYRMNFPEDYRGTIIIKKFERNFGGEKTQSNPIARGRTLEYVFKDAYPLSVASVPVSYNSSELLKYTVSFTYSRYYIESNRLGGVSINPESRNQGTVPTSQGVTPQTIGEDLFNTLA
jgi:hypothetical protein